MAPRRRAPTLADLRAYARLFASKGGKARAAKLTAEERHAAAKKAARARKLTPEQRSKIARGAALARWRGKRRRRS